MEIQTTLPPVETQLILNNFSKDPNNCDCLPGYGWTPSASGILTSKSPYTIRTSDNRIYLWKSTTTPYINKEGLNFVKSRYSIEEVFENDSAWFRTNVTAFQKLQLYLKGNPGKSKLSEAGLPPFIWGD